MSNRNRDNNNRLKKDKIGHNITFYIDQNGEITITDLPSDFGDLVKELIKT